MSALRAVLFDMDGTLVETESLWYQVEIETMTHFGATWTETDRTNTIGGPFDKVGSYMAEVAGVSLSDIETEMTARMEAAMNAGALRVQPGVRELYREVREAKLLTALVSNSWRHLMNIVISQTGFDFNAVVAGDDGHPNKPDPSPYLIACEQLGVQPLDTVAIEDSVTGVESATEAGCAVLAVPEHVAIESRKNRLVVHSLADVNLSMLQWLVRLA